jgi:hypothetical protein
VRDHGPTMESRASGWQAPLQAGTDPGLRVGRRR